MLCSKSMRKRQQHITQCRQEPAGRPRTSGRVPSADAGRGSASYFGFWLRAGFPGEGGYQGFRELLHPSGVLLLFLKDNQLSNALSVNGFDLVCADERARESIFDSNASISSRGRCAVGRSAGIFFSAVGGC